MPESRDSPRRKPRPQTDIFQNLVRKGNVTWSALDILDFNCIVPEVYSSCGLVWKSTQKAIIGCKLNTPHHIISIIGHVAFLRSHYHSIERMREIEKSSFFLHIQPDVKSSREDLDFFFFLDKFLSLTH